MDSLIAHALTSLSFDERQRQQEVLHGVATEIPENAQMLSEAFETLHCHLEKIKRVGSSYQMAESLDVSYVSDKAFRLMFLRGNRFDAKAAADQMIRFFDMKHQLFGRDKLTKDITIEDLDEDDLAFMRAGSVQVTETDRAGRPIWFALPGLRAFKCLQNELRARYYMAMELLKSEQAQRRGIVSITYAIGRYRDCMNGTGYVELVRQVLALPFHKAALHNCVSDPKEYILGSAAMAVIPVKDRSRIRLHLGSHMEIHYILSTYGIPSSKLPLHPKTNDAILDRHMRWYNDCLARDTGGHQFVVEKQMDTIMSDTSIVEQKQHHFASAIGSNDPMVVERPGRNDVVLGRNNKGHGNQLMMSLVKDLAKDYDSAGRGEKWTIADSIVQRIREQGGRFLQQQSDGNWEEVANDFARSKISKCFRNHRRIKKKNGGSSLDLTVPIVGDFDF
ncbi:unnamed protein product [Cylindrotheca closterium]|uniref:DUF6824 domain-containing protein n=1 Tax=Cylindrotheca closterium TaxID=2856 RepID=A0AAD2CFH9_9STRA|nr:unnamed protein product [Cylindrotheca closterium]